MTVIDITSRLKTKRPVRKPATQAEFWRDFLSSGRSSKKFKNVVVFDTQKKRTRQHLIRMFVGRAQYAWDVTDNDSATEEEIDALWDGLYNLTRDADRKGISKDVLERELAAVVGPLDASAIMSLIEM